jgi:hypothetical protein
MELGFLRCETTTMSSNKRKATVGEDEIQQANKRRVLDVTAPYDSDDEPPVEAYGKRLDWRLDASENLSDWTIEITHQTPSEQDEATSISKTETYHVHMNILAVGSRRSEYFARLFLSAGENFAESKSKTSKIKLEEIAANAFPQMLDYLYWPEKELHVTIETATALHHLGSYGGTPSSSGRRISLLRIVMSITNKLFWCMTTRSKKPSLKSSLIIWS